LETETFEFDPAEQMMIEQALDFKVWSTLDDLLVAIKALAKVDARAAKRAVSEACDQVAAIAAEFGDDAEPIEDEAA
jgi:hypothetical protein